MIVDLAKISDTFNINENTNVEPEIITKKFLLIGLEKQMNLADDFSESMDELCRKLKQNTEKLKDVMISKRQVGFWQPGGVYFAGFEVSERVDISGFIIKDIPESLFAVIREYERGTAGRYIYTKWLPNTEYCVNEAIAGDFEIFDDMEHGEFAPCDIMIPIKHKNM